MKLLFHHVFNWTCITILNYMLFIFSRILFLPRLGLIWNVWKVLVFCYLSAVMRFICLAIVTAHRKGNLFRHSKESWIWKTWQRIKGGRVTWVDYAVCQCEVILYCSFYFYQHVKTCNLDFMNYQLPQKWQKIGVILLVFWNKSASFILELRFLYQWG